MSQHDMAIANQLMPAARTDLNLALVALASTNGGTSAPATIYAGQFWHDTTNDLLMIRNAANSAWITAAEYDTSNDRWQPQFNIAQADSTAGFDLKNSTGTSILTLGDTGAVGGQIIASQAQAEAGTATDKLMNPLRTAQAITALAGAQAFSRLDVEDMTADATDLTLVAGGSYNYIQARFAAEVVGTSGNMRLQARASAGTWRTLSTLSTISTNDVVMASLEVINNADGAGTAIKHIKCSFDTVGATMDRSDAENIGSVSSLQGTSSRSEVWTEFRIEGRNMEGSTADRAGNAELWGVV